jgi:hypothetical protein
MVFATIVLFGPALKSIQPSSESVHAAISPPDKTDKDLRPWVTAEEFRLLTPGLITYSEIANLIGPGEMDASARSLGIKTESYTWKNPDGSFMSLMFQNEKLVMKSQYGLK